MGKNPPHRAIILSPRNATLQPHFFGLGFNTTLGMTLFMRWASDSVLVGCCMARTAKTRIPGHKMLESGDRQE